MTAQTEDSDIGTGPAAVRRLVDRLHDLAEGKDDVSVDHFVREIGAQGHAPLLLAVAILMVLPIGMIPGVGGALGALVAIIGLQMLLGRGGIWLPRFLGKRCIPADRVSRMTERIMPLAEWLRRHLHPRWTVLTDSPWSIGAIAVILMVSGGSLLILGAIPVAAPMMGLPVALFAFGILAKDGRLVAVGYLWIAATVAGLVLWGA